MLGKNGVLISAAFIALAGCSGEPESPDFVPVLKSIEVSPKAATLAPGTKGTFSALGCFTTPPSRGDELSCRDITNAAKWESLEVNIASVSGPTALAKLRGDTIITAGMAGVEDTADLLVNGAVLERLEISPGTSEVPLGLKQQFVATGIFVEDGEDVSSQDLSDQVDWSSAQEHIAPIDDNGLADGESIGEADISASMVNAEGSEVSDTAPLVVTDAVLQKVALNLEPEREELPEGSRKIFRSYGLFSDDSCRNVSYEISEDTDPEIGFFSSDDSVARMDPYSAETGGVSAYGVPTDPDLVEPAPSAGSPPAIPRPVVDDSHCEELVAAEDSSKQSKTNSFSKAENLGDVIITSTYRNTDGGILVDTASIFRSPAELASIRVAPENGVDPSEISPGFDLQFLAFAVYTDGSEIEITDSPDTLWTTSDNTISTVRNQNDAGLAEGVSAGDVTVNATLSGITGSAPLAVLSSTLQSIALGPDLFCVGATRVPETVAQGSFDPNTFPPEIDNEGQVVPGGQELVANGLFSEGEIVDVSENVIWTAQYGVWSKDDQRCADPITETTSPATVSNAPGMRGDVSSDAQVLLGTSCIVATHPATGVVGGATAIVLPVLEDDISETELCDAIKPVLNLGEDITGTGVPIELISIVGQVLQPVLTNLEVGDVDAQDVVADVVGLVGQLTDPATPATSPLLGSLRDAVLSPALDGAHGLLCAIIPDSSCE